MTPCHFGSSDAPLFGVFYPAKVRPGRSRAVLLCYPGPEEYMRVHWAFRNLTHALVKTGFAVFKFDYSGTGDSAGSSDEVNVDAWRRDIIVAAEELGDMAGTERVTLIGARLGAALAATLPPMPGVVVDELVLWDPVACGAEYIDELLSLEIRRMSNSRYPLERQLKAARPEVLGYAFPKALQESLRALNLAHGPLTKASHTTLVTSMAQLVQDDVKARLGSSANLTHIAVDEACNWRGQELLEQALLASRVVQAIAEHLTRPA